MSASIESTASERLQRLEDAAEIQKMLHEYARCLDDNDIRAYARLFADDGEWRSGNKRAIGREAIYELVTEIMNEFWHEQAGPTKHMVSNVSVEVDGDSASGQVVWAFVRASAEAGPYFHLVGHYEDTYVRERGAWRFARRESVIDLPATS